MNEERWGTPMRPLLHLEGGPCHGWMIAAVPGLRRFEHTVAEPGFGLVKHVYVVREDGTLLYREDG